MRGLRGAAHPSKPARRMLRSRRSLNDSSTVARGKELAKGCDALQGLRVTYQRQLREGAREGPGGIAAHERRLRKC